MIGLLVIFIGGGLLWARFLLLDKQEIHIHGALAFVREADELKESPIFGYDFNESICEFLSAFLNENQAFKKLFWKTRKLRFKPSTKFEPEQLDFYTMVISTVEFWYLHHFDLHLNSYFVENRIDTSTIVEINREQLDSNILKNRVLELFTRRMQERDAFIDHPLDECKGVIVSSTGKGGAIYEHLGIELPPNSRIFRDPFGHIVVKNRYFALTMECQFNGYFTFIPRELLKSTLKMSDYPYNVGITLKIKSNPFRFLSPHVAQQYEWLDSFIARVVDEVSTDRLVSRLDPNLKEFLKS